MVFRILITHKSTNDYEQEFIRLCFFTTSVFCRIWSKTFLLYAHMVICVIYQIYFLIYTIYGKYTIY